MAGLTKEQREAKRLAQQTSETLNQDASFQEVQGAPAVEHQKKIQRQLKASKKYQKPFKQFFTIKDGKVLSVKVKENGAYSTYVGTKAKMEKKEKGSYFNQVKVWQKQNLWVSEEDFQEFCDQAKTELQVG
jgi:hypothetical protein